MKWFNVKLRVRTVVERTERIEADDKDKAMDAILDKYAHHDDVLDVIDVVADDEDIINAVVAEFFARGFQVSNEYPGYVHVDWDGSIFAIGNINDNWCVDLRTENGDTVASSDTGVPANTTDVKTIADASVVAMVAIRQRAAAAKGGA